MRDFIVYVMCVFGIVKIYTTLALGDVKVHFIYPKIKYIPTFVSFNGAGPTFVIIYGSMFVVRGYRMGFFELESA